MVNSVRCQGDVCVVMVTSVRCQVYICVVLVTSLCCQGDPVGGGGAATAARQDVNGCQR